MPFAKTDDGARIFYSSEGEGPAVLMLQGVGVAGCAWGPQIAPLKDRFRMIAVDNRGVGQSTTGSSKLSIERMASDAVSVLDDAGEKRVHVVGHSMGGLIAIALALENRARVLSLALMCTLANGPEFARPGPWLIWTAIRTSIGTRRMRRHGFVNLVTSRSERAESGHDALAERLGAAFGRDLADAPKIAMAQGRALGKCDASPRLPELSGLPVLVVAAQEDPIGTPARGRALADAIAGAVYAEVEDSSHACTILRADEINGLLAAHLPGE